MSKNAQLRVRTASVLVAGLLAGGVLAAPAALAAAPAAPSLQTTTPAVIGLGGGSVQMFETLSNPAGTELKADLKLTAEVGTGSPANGLAIDWYDTSAEAFKPVPLTFAGGVFTGTLPGGVTVPAGGSTKLKLRIGAPMGGPHNGATNGGFPSVSLKSTATAAGASQPLAETVKTIAVQGLDAGMSPQSGDVVAGGAPVEFETSVFNPTESDYDELSNVLFFDRHAKAEWQDADGGWHALAASPADPGDADRVGVRILDKDAIGAHKLINRRVRISFAADTPLGQTKIGRCAIVNESEQVAWQGTTMCTKGAVLNVVAPKSAPAPTTPAPTTPAPTTPAPSTTAAAPVTEANQDAQGGDQRLAETGSRGSGIVAGLGAALLAVGGGVLWFGRRRSS